jgi:hypothetical protein
MFICVDLEQNKHYTSNWHGQGKFGELFPYVENKLYEEVEDWLENEAGYYFIRWKKRRVCFFSRSDALAFKLRF